MQGGKTGKQGCFWAVFGHLTAFDRYWPFLSLCPDMGKITQ